VSALQGPGPPALEERTARIPAGDGRELALTELCAPAPAAPGAPAFLLVHGFAQNRRSFTLGPLPGLLAARGARVFCGELRGHGASRADRRESWSLATHLEHDAPALLAATRRAAAVERVHWVGHSMGGLLGCALLSRPEPLASISAIATPLLLGADRPLVRLASFFAGPLAQLAPAGQRVPMDRLLAALAGPLSAPAARGPLALLQRVTRLASPRHAPPALLAEVLASADPESPAVFAELAANAVLGRARIAGVDLLAALREAPLPVAAVVGSGDIFAPRASVAPLDAPGQRGPRRVIEIAGAAHVDLTLGPHLESVVDELWPFLTGSQAEPRRSRAQGRSAR
jgi:pimeloyl-ACP methyl ester carboxylesterase